MKQSMINDAEVISQFCRLNITIKRDLPIRASEMGMLIFTSRQKTLVNPLSISEFFHIAKPSVTTTVKTLISKGYLDKKISTVDQRSYSLSITEKGRELVETTQQEFLRTMLILEQGLGQQDYQRMVEILERANGILTLEKSR